MNYERFNTKKEKIDKIKLNCKLMFVLILVLCLYAVAFKSDKKVEMLKSHGGGMSIEQMKLQAYFHKAGSPHSVEVAKAVQLSKRPKLAAAIAKTESDGVKTAYNKKSKAKGLYGVKEQYWGKVNTRSAFAMTMQHDRIMDELLRECNGNLEKTLNYYGGDKSKKVYAKNILAELEKIP